MVVAAQKLHIHHSRPVAFPSADMDPESCPHFAAQGIRVLAVYSDGTHTPAVRRKEAVGGLPQSGVLQRGDQRWKRILGLDPPWCVRADYGRTGLHAAAVVGHCALEGLMDAWLISDAGGIVLFADEIYANWVIEVVRWC